MKEKKSMKLKTVQDENDLRLVTNVALRINSEFSKAGIDGIENEAFEEIANEFFGLHEKIEDPIALVLLISATKIDTYRLQEIIKKSEEIIKKSEKWENEISRLRKQNIDLYDDLISKYKLITNQTKELISYISLSQSQRKQFDSLMNKLYEARIFYLTYYDEFEKIKLDKEFSEKEKLVAMNFVDDISTYKAAFIILAYRKRNDTNFRKVFSDLKEIEFEKIAKNEIHKLEQEGILINYYERFYDSFKKSKPKVKGKGLPKQK